MPRRNPSLVGAKPSHQSARTPRSQASKPTPRQARRPAPEPSNRRARRNKFVTFYRGGHLRSGFQLRIRHPTRKIFTCAETDTIEPARIGQGRCPRDARSRSRGARQAWARRGRDARDSGSASGKRGRDASDSGSTSCRKRLIPHGTPYPHRLLSRKRRPRRGRQRRPPPTARPRRCGPGAGCEGSPQEAAALQSRRQWRHLGGR